MKKSFACIAVLLFLATVDFSSVETMDSTTDTQLKDVIRNGKGAGMPKYADFTDHQVAALVRYIRSLSQSP